MGILAVVLVASWFSANAEFVNTSNEQQADGYFWSQLNCREAIPGLPALKIVTPTGKELVCNKLVK